MLVGAGQARRAGAASPGSAVGGARRGRGADARPWAAAAVPPACRGGGGGGRVAGSAAERVDLRDLATFTIDPASTPATSTTRSPRAGWRTAIDPGCGSTSPTCAHTCRPDGTIDGRGLPPRHERLRARSRGADAAGGAVERGVLAAPGRGQAGGHGRDGHRRAPTCGGCASMRTLIRSDARADLRRGRRGASPAGSGRASPGARRWRRRARWRRAGASGARPARSRSSSPGAVVRASTATAT